MWFKYLLIAVFALSPIVSIARIGEAREPYTKTYALADLIVSVLLVVGILYYWR